MGTWGTGMQTPTAETNGRPRIGRSAGASCAPDPSLAVCTRGLSKHYVHPWTLRRTHGLDDLDLDVRRGGVLG